MKRNKWIIAVPLAALLYACVDRPKGDSEKTVSNYVVKIIDGCEYLEFEDGLFEYRVYSLTHKGNCKNHKQPSFINLDSGYVAPSR